MFKTATEIAKHTGLSFSTINQMLSRAEFNKHRYGVKFQITLDFITELYKLFQLKKIAKGYTQDKYRIAQAKLMQWKRYIEGRKYDNQT